MSVRHPVRLVAEPVILILEVLGMTDKLSVTDYDIFCGMDVDAKSIVADFLDWGDRIKEIGVPNKAENILRYVEKHYRDKRVVFVYEAGPTGFGLYDGLSAAGQLCLVAAPSMVPTAAGQRVKTNRLDARKLAINLRGGQIDGIHVPCILYRDLRHLVQWRDSCVRDIGRNQRRIKSLLLLEGMEDAGCRWNVQTMEALKKLDCRAAIRFKLDELLGGLDLWRQKLKAANERLRRFYQEHAELNECITYLMSVAGVGWITASHFLARVGDWRCLGTTAQTCGFLGLGASEHSTGKRVKRGPITAVGDRRLRAKLIQCAWRAIKKDEELRECFERIYRSNPLPIAPRKAIVAVARKIVSRMHAVLRDQRLYWDSKNTKQQEADFPGQTRLRPRAKERLAAPEARFCRKGSREFAPKAGRIKLSVTVPAPCHEYQAASVAIAKHSTVDKKEEY